MTLETEGTRGRSRGLRFRLVVLFAVGGLVLSSVFALGTYSFAKRYLVSQRERTAQRQAFLDAHAFRGALGADSTSVADALAGLEVPTGTSVVIRKDGSWYGTSVALGRDDVPTELRALVRNGGAGHQRISTAGGPAIAIGLRIPALDADYFEIVVLSELASTLQVIRDTLFGAAALTTIAAALLGIWAARRVLSPLREVERDRIGDRSRRSLPTPRRPR